ncbi:uncharacterized protein C8Q71DRAFT_890843 [Rhodofomes roseus]|uniref:Uncharacterized protein n=1 Tax=Rhodofomes roseus TaxID=34475 RepID=A0ABQ8KRR4_9APHY|nr:uncharacterized protein C8Q71DRAFT_890843 [Rhodofomes roseus]KAH9841092.1 hypothetical protein C8Q71DRAFT_890843 [Rhodofomes roseus]
MKQITNVETVDSPDTVATGLAPPLIPTEGGRILDEDLTKIIEAEPLSKLPRILVPDPEESVMKPPVMHYGWPIDHDVLLDIAEEHGLTVYLPSGNDTLVEDGWENEWQEPIDRCHNIKLTATIANVMQAVTEEVGAWVPLNLVKVWLGLQGSNKRRSPAIISFYTNYNLDCAYLPPLEEIEKMREVLKIQDEGPPRWYLDADHYRWRPWRERREHPTWFYASEMPTFFARNELLTNPSSSFAIGSDRMLHADE